MCECVAKIHEEVFKDVGPSDKLIGSIDQGTSSTRFLAFTVDGRIAASAQMEHTQIYFPEDEDKVGWHEHDPMELWENTKTTLDAVVAALRLRGVSSPEFAAVGITNQRETTLAWNICTGVPYYNAIVWDDTRTISTAARISEGDPDRLRSRTGLPIASYFAGTKVRWLVENVPDLKRDLLSPSSSPEVLFGTVDSWLLYQLTGTAQPSEDESLSSYNTGGIHVTDATNASRWLFMDLATCRWDQDLVREVIGPTGVELSVDTALPEIRPSSGVFAHVSERCGIQAFADSPPVPIASILGDQQAALFGQTAFKNGQAKCTYGTGLFLVMNTSTVPVPSTSGLITTVAYQLSGKGNDPNPPCCYALEGSVAWSGSTIQWLRDQLEMIKDAAETGDLALSIPGNAGMYMVPAFSGLFAPYWRPDARGCIVGLTATHSRAHFCRAALESTAYQARDMVDAMVADTGGRFSLKSLRVDGGATANSFLMQFQADMLGGDSDEDDPVEVVVPAVMETTALGAAFAAGLAVGFWQDTDQLVNLWASSKIYRPSMDHKLREKNHSGWKKALTKSFGWVQEDDDAKEK